MNMLSREKFVFSNIPTTYGELRFYVFSEAGQDHVAVVKGIVTGKGKVLCRVHSECITSEVFGSLKCDCREQLQAGLKRISKEGGVLIYLRQEGRGIGLRKKIQAYRLQEKCGLDTVEANRAIGEVVDRRDFQIAAKILKALGVKSIRLLTNNPDKVAALRKYGITVERITHSLKPNKYNKGYLSVKKKKLRHAIKGV